MFAYMCVFGITRWDVCGTRFRRLSPGMDGNGGPGPSSLLPFLLQRSHHLSLVPPAALHTTLLMSFAEEVNWESDCVWDVVTLRPLLHRLLLSILEHLALYVRLPLGNIWGIPGTVISSPQLL